MATKGALADFNVTNILQIIKLEGQTGQLTLNRADSSVKLTFDSGALVYGESGGDLDEKRIEATLLGSALISEPIWESIRADQGRGVKSYWDLLKGKIADEILMELTRRQVIESFYRALRFSQGTYDFKAMKGLKYNRKFMRPIDLDALLIEGCRIADEFERTAHLIPPFDASMRKTILDSDGSLSSPLLGDQWFSSGAEREKVKSIALTPAEESVLSVCGSSATIARLVYGARVSQFEAMVAIRGLMDKRLITQTGATPKKRLGRAGAGKFSSIGWSVLAVLFGLAALGALSARLIEPPGFISTDGLRAAELKELLARRQIERLKVALMEAKAITGRAPERLDQLRSRSASDPPLIDPWGRPYFYRPDALGDRFELYSHGADLSVSDDDITLRR